MKNLKVVTIVGTRPEIIRLSRVISSLDKFCDHVLIHTGQNYDYELNQVFFDDLGIRKPDFFLDTATDSNSAAQTIGNLISAVDKVLAQIQPDAVLVLGDTNSCLSVIPAKRRKIPIFHMEAGNRCFDQRVPEEINRRIVDHTADINLTYSDIAREYLLREGLPPDQVIKTGSPMFEVLEYYKRGIEASDVVERLDLKPEQYFLVSAHREENIEPTQSFNRFTTMLNKLAETYNIPIIVSTHPRTRNKISESQNQFHSLIKFMKPLGFNDYVKLQKCAHCVLSDSGTINEESSILNFPALNLRDSHERPEGMEEAAVMMVGMNFDRIHQCLQILKEQGRSELRSIRLVNDYSMPNVSAKVVRIIHSYVDFVGQNVWKKY